MNLKKIEKKTLKFLKKHNIDKIDFVNKINFTRLPNDELEEITVHKAHYEGGFILVGGWCKIWDDNIPSGTKGHQLYLRFGGLGVGGWKGNGEIDLILEDGSNTPKYTYGKDPTKAWDWFRDNVKSCMLMYLPQFIQPFPIYAFFDKHSREIAVFIPNVAPASFIGGASVEVLK